jgi:hypothetical protein
MSSPLRSPKALTDWLELDYFSRPRPLRWYRRWLTWGLFLASLAAAVAVWCWARPEIYQAEPVSQAHTMFNNDCRVCHADTLQTAKRLWPTRTGFHSVTDDACTSCHDGPDHRPQVSASGCAGCHQEHRGQKLLSLVPDSHCNTCHTHLAEHSPVPPSVQDVRGFSAAGDHPEFRLWRDTPPVDPSQVRFNHEVHLRTDGVLMPGGKRKVLECGACHQLAGDRRYMQPINYNAHCAECHPLSVLIAGRNDESALQFSRDPAPHQRAEIVSAVVEQRFRRFFRDHQPLEMARAVKRPFPGKMPPPPKTRSEEEWVSFQYEFAERMLFSAGGICRYCHLEGSVPWQPGQLPSYAETKIPSRWFAKSQFSHGRHRFLRCDECHAETKASKQAKDVLMPRIAACQNCHNAQVGARYDCSECHQYHDRRQEMPGRGSLSIHDCLRTR